jgi:ABC-2 type transport system permease protein
MFAAVGPGARIGRDIAGGWTRQLRITPLRPSTDMAAKVVCAYLLAVPTLVLLYLAGASLGVRLAASQWLEMTGLILVGLAPFVVIGFVLGYLLPVDAMMPALGGIIVLFSLFGGVYGFELAKSGPMFAVMKALPSYWLVQAGKSVAAGGGGWPGQAWLVIAAWTILLVPLARRAYQRNAARA